MVHALEGYDTTEDLRHPYKTIKAMHNSDKFVKAEL